MANTYTQIHIQAVFTVQNKSCIIHSGWKEELLQQFGIDYNDNYIFKPVEANYFVPDGTSCSRQNLFSTNI